MGKNNNQIVPRNSKKIAYNNYPSVNSNIQAVSPSHIFRGNIAHNMRFGNSGDELSGFVHREIIVIDCHGNKQIAREEQFFNSGKSVNVNIKKGKNDSRN